MVQSIYDSKQYTELVFLETDAESQDDAHSMLRDLGLAESDREDLARRWSVRWSSSGTRNRGAVKWSRSLYQWYMLSLAVSRSTVVNARLKSICGYNEKVRQDLDKPANPGPRRAPYDFTGCLAHVEVTQYDTGEVTRIIGIVEHNAQCEGSKLVRYPPIPLHRDVYNTALNQLSNGARYTVFHNNLMQSLLITTG